MNLDSPLVQSATLLAVTVILTTKLVMLLTFVYLLMKHGAIQ